MSARGVLALQARAGNRAVSRMIAAVQRCAPENPGCDCESEEVQRSAAEPGHGMLRTGSSGPEVAELQRRLGITADGVFGPQTRAAVAAFQRSSGLAADGVVGPATWSALPAGGAPGPDPRYAELTGKIRAAVDSLVRIGGSAASAPPPVLAMGAVQRSWVGDAWDTVTDTASDAWDTAKETASDAWDTAKGAASDAWNTVTDTAGKAWDTATGGAETVVKDASDGVRDALAGIGGDLRARYGGEIAVLEDAIRQLGAGHRLSDEEIARLTALVDKAIKGLPLDVLPNDKNTAVCPKQADEVAFTETPVTFDANGLDDLNKQVFSAMGGSVGHLTFSNGPGFAAPCLDSQGRIPPGGAKVIAKGSATIPQRGTVKSPTNDPREETGIQNYFTKIAAHERTHTQIYRTAFTGLSAKLVGLTMDQATAKFDAVTCAAHKSQDALDDREGCMVVTSGKDADTGPGSLCGNTGVAAKTAGCP